MKYIKITLLFILSVLILAACGGALNATIGGTVSGLAGGTSVGLLNNGSNLTTVNSNGNFTFSQTVGSGSNYNVTVNNQPTGETCSVVNGSGSVDSTGNNVTNVQVNCVAGSTSTSAVTASISGLAIGTTVILVDNGVDKLTVSGTSVTASGGTITQLFPTPLTIGSNYNVTVGTQPSGQVCTVTNSIGQIPTTGSPSPVIVTCI